MLKQILPAALLLAVPVAAVAQPAEPPPAERPDPTWELAGDARVEDHLGRQAIRMGMGLAHCENVRFEDGTIELDLAVTPYRSFAYVQFRIQESGENEEFYFRSHKSGLPDAIQYTPVYRRESNWQLYHGADDTAAAWLPPEEWIHVRIVVRGDRAAVFVGDAPTPQLVTTLDRPAGPGDIALRSFRPRGIPDGVFLASYSNVVIRSGVVDFDFPEPSAVESPAGVVKQWRVSPAFAPQAGAVTEVPAETLAAEGWQTLAADPSGLVVIGRDVAKPEGVRRAAAAARIVVRAAEAARRRFDFGYSDEVSVFLNGELLFSGNDRYSFNFPRRQGLITIDQGSLYLPLAAGDNELLLVVTDVFGGWGVMGRFPDSEGLEVLAK